MKKKKILCITSSFPVHPRLKKIGESFKYVGENNGDFETVYISWDRLNNDHSADEWTYVSREGYGNRLKKLWGLIAYFRFIKKKIHAFDPDIIICRFFDMAVIGSLLSQNRKLVYDINDIPSDKNPIVTFIYKCLEWIALKRSDVIILSSRFFQFRYSGYSRKIQIMENKPEKVIQKPGVYDFKTPRFVVSFIGVIRYFSVLENLILALKDRNVDLLFFGYGPDDDRVKALIEKCNIKNVHLFGRFSYRDIHKLYNISDIVWAAYPATTINTRNAISNKFFETILFKKPGVFNRNTSLGHYVDSHGIGYTVNPESFSEVDGLFDQILQGDRQYGEIIENMTIYEKNNASCWEDNKYDKFFLLTGEQDVPTSD